MDVRERNVETIRRIHAGVNARDLDASIALLDPGFELDYSASRQPIAGKYKGAAQVKELIESNWEVWDEFRWEAEEMTALDDDRVLVVNHAYVRGGASGIEVDARGVQLWTFRDGRPVAMRLYQTRDEVPDA